MTVVTIDLGTTICKIQAFDPDGRVTFSFSQEIQTRHPRPDWAEQDPQSWWDVVVRGFQELGRRRARDVDLISTCSHRESILGVDARGEVIIPCMLWADRRCTEEAMDLDSQFGSELHQRTGMKADPYFTAPKLLWANRNIEEKARRVEKYLLPKDYLTYRLTGSFTTDWTVASRTAMLEIRKKRWWTEMLEYLGVSESQLCEPGDSFAMVGGPEVDVCRELGVGVDCEVVAGAGDRQCEALGSGVTSEKAMESTGSATNLSISAGQLPRRLAPGILYSCHSIRDQYLVEQGIGSTGLGLRWFRDTFLPPGDKGAFRRDPYAFIDLLASRSPAGARGLLFLPFMMGAQATRWNPSARGVIFGLTLGHEYGDIARAILEGIAYEIRASIEVLQAQRAEPRTIVALGGSARSEVWNQIKADVAGRKYSRPRVTGSATLGALILARMGQGSVISTRELNPLEQEYVPNPANSAVYERAYEQYGKLYKACMPLFEAIGRD